MDLTQNQVVEEVHRCADCQELANPEFRLPAEPDIGGGGRVAHIAERTGGAGRHGCRRGARVVAAGCGRSEIQVVERVEPETEISVIFKSYERCHWHVKVVVGDWKGHRVRWQRFGLLDRSDLSVGGAGKHSNGSHRDDCAGQFLHDAGNGD